MESVNSCRVFLRRPVRSSLHCLVLLTAVLFGSNAWAAATWVQTAGASAAGGTSASATLSKASGAGNGIVVCVGSNEPITSIRDNRASTYTLLGQVSNSSSAGTLRVYYARPRRGGVTSVTVSHPWGHSDIVISEYRGLVQLDKFAAQDAGYNTGAAWSSGATATTTQTGEQIIGCGFEVYASALPVTFTAGAGFTPRLTQRGVFLEDRSAAAPGSVAATGTRSPSSNLNVIAAVAAFTTSGGTTPPPPTDTQAPSVPANLVANGASQTQINLSWSASTDNIGVTGYRVHRAGQQIATVTSGTSYQDSALTAATTYSYTVAAYDAAGNVSAQSAPAQATTASNPPPPPPPTNQGLAVLFIDVESGPTSGGPNNLGAPIAIFGKGFGASRGSSRVTIGGVEVASYLVWGQNNAHNPFLDMIVVQPGPAVTGGPVVVNVNGNNSNVDQTFTANTGSIYYLATNGVDNTTCSQAAPCATIHHAATNVMRAGDVLLARGGSYSENEVWIRGEYGHSGTLGQQKVIKNYPGEEVYLPNAARPFIVDADYITVSGMNFQNGKSLGIPDTGLPGRRGNRFINNTFIGTIGFGAVDTHGDDHQVAGNVCDVANSTVGTQGHCYYISYGSGVEILYNVGGGAPGYGLHIFDQRRSSSDFQRVIKNMLVEGNLLKNSTLRSGMIIAMADEGGNGNYIDNIIVRGNTFTANSHLGLAITGIVRNVTITGNSFYENGRQGLHIADDPGVSGVTVSGNNFTQSANSNCLNDCTWYNLAHAQKGARAANVTINGNYYTPAPPVVIGASDAAPAATPFPLVTP